MNEDSLYNRLAKGILTDEEIDNLVDEIMNIPVEKNNNCLSSYGSINVDDLIDSIKELRKVPTYDELLRENKQLKEQLEKERKVRKKSINKIKTLGKFDGEKCTRGLKLWGADFNELLDILDIDKGE